MIVMNDPREEYLTLEEVAKKLKVGKTTVYRMAKSGKLPAVKIGKAWRFSNIRISELFHKK